MKTPKTVTLPCGRKLETYGGAFGYRLLVNGAIMMGWPIFDSRSEAFAYARGYYARVAETTARPLAELFNELGERAAVGAAL